MKKRYIDNLLKEISKIKDVVSVNLVGTFFEKEIEEISDIDFVVIVDELNKKNFQLVISHFVNFNHKDYLGDYEIVINNTFGPMKIYENGKIILHIMVYDLKGHIDHVIKSPFTCFDWERSENYYLTKLNHIFSTNRLMLKDFIQSRRGISDYKNDLKNKTLTIRKYKFEENNEYKVIKEQKELDPRHMTEYSYHIVKNLINNYLKFILNTNKVESINEHEFKQHLPEIFEKYRKNIELLTLKKTRKEESTEEEVRWVPKFLEDFYFMIKEIENISSKIIFIRHAKTRDNNKNIFLGNKTDPEILNKNSQKNKYQDYECFISPAKRSKQTAIKYGFKNFEESKLLREINYGAAEGMEVNTFFKNYPKIIESWSNKIDTRFPGGENNQDVLSRVNEFLNTLSVKKSFVITHQVFLRCMLGELFEIPKHSWYLIHIPHNTPLEVIKIGDTFYPNITRNMYKNIFKNFALKEVSNNV